MSSQSLSIVGLVGLINLSVLLVLVSYSIEYSIYNT